MVQKRSVEIPIRLSEEQHRRLKWVADKLGLSVSEALMSFIPNIQLSDARVVTKNSEIVSAGPDDLVPVKRNFDRKKLLELVDEIYEKKAAITLAREIKQQLIERIEPNNESLKLTVETYRRLSRWCHPRRYTDREKNIQPLAEEISKLIFNKIIDRINT
ncbi:MAG: hypothetical protein ACYSUC_02710 [Planctomycetota bacterium]|jgi:hypothetical protein